MRPKPSDDLPDHSPADQASTLYHGMTIEEIRDLKAWARKTKRPGNESFRGLKRARTVSKIRNGVLMALAALGIGGGIANKDSIGQWIKDRGTAISSWWKTGFNDSPRGPYPGITLHDPNAQRDLQCLSEAFYNNATLYSELLPGNRWEREHCGPTRARFGAVYDDSTAIARAKNDILEEQDVFDRPARQAPVEWFDYGGIPGMRVITDKERLEERRQEQIRTTGTSTFDIE